MLADCKMPEAEVSNGYWFCPDGKNDVGKCYLQCEQGWQSWLILIHFYANSLPSSMNKTKLKSLNIKDLVQE